MINASIWEDVIYVASGVQSINYLLYDENDNLLFAGKAIGRPDTGEPHINISRLVQNYLNSNLPEEAFNGPDFVAGQVFEPNAILSFTLANEKGTTLEQYRFLNCWDYKLRLAFIVNPGVAYPLSIPANNHQVSDMYTFSSVLTKTNKVRTTIGTGNVGDYCGYGALYYSNALGGWDSFLIEGNIIKKDSYERYTIDNKWMSYTLQPGTRTLVNTIEESWTLNTHLLRDNEAKILAEHLFGSNNVYFHSFADNTITPVVITDTSIDYKNWRNQKRKRFYLTINIKSCQPKQRI